MKIYHQKIPSNGLKREALREQGQFWTPDWIAEAMVGYTVSDGCDQVFDPAVGEGAFFRAAKAIERETGGKFNLLGTEKDPNTLQQALQNGLSESDLVHVQITDFILYPPKRLFKAIACNPPYIRHHRIPNHVKAELKKFSTSLIGKALDGRTGLHVYFLLRALQLLDVNGRLAFIMPADTCEGIFSSILWNWITKNYRLEAVVIFTPEASPFPGVDTNPIIFMIRNAKPKKHFLWGKSTKPHIKQLKEWTLSGFKSKPSSVLLIYQRTLAEGLATGLSRESLEGQAATLLLGDFAKVLRGIATGDNEFFFLTARQAANLRIPNEFLIPAIGRTRDIPYEQISLETLNSLRAKDRPTLLFSPDGRPQDSFPQPIREYLRQGETRGVNKKPLISTRHPWYKMGVRPIPPFLFAYLGRRNARFIRNLAGVVPLTGFLCVYPHEKDASLINKLWEVLQHPATIANLSLVGKTYGAGAIKVEPRALEKLPLPTSIVAAIGLHPSRGSKQFQLSNYD
ncbi:MAG: N-6 DNA methylase [Ignavibacteriales bacterium]